MYHKYNVFAGSMYVGYMLHALKVGSYAFISRDRVHSGWSDTPIQRVAQYKKLHLNRVF